MNRDNLGRFVNEHIPWNKGMNVDRSLYQNIGHFKKQLKETRDKISEKKKGRHASTETEFKIGNIPWNNGKKGLQKENKTSFKKGQTTREKNCNWNGGVTPLNQKIRHSNEYIQWRREVFERDNYTCQDCERKGGRLHAHHNKPFAKFPELRFDVDNGMTLCKECHRFGGGKN